MPGATDPSGDTDSQTARAAIVECTKNSRRAFAIAAMTAFYQLAAVTGVTSRELLANSNELQLPLVGVSTPLTGFFILSCALVVVMTIHLHGQLVLLAGLVGDFVREHPDEVERREMLYPWTPLHEMVWWAVLRGLAPGKRRPEDGSTLDIAMRIAYLFLLASFVTIAFTVALSVVLSVYKNSSDTVGRAVIATCIAATVTTGVWATLASHRRLRQAAATTASRQLFSLGFPCALVFAIAFSSAFLASSRQSLARADLSGLDLQDHDFGRADLTEADLTAARLNGANFEGATLRHATLALARLTGADLTDADLRSADLRGAILRRAVLDGTNLSESRLDYADFTEAKVTCGSWDDARGQSITFKGTTFIHCGFAGRIVSAEESCWSIPRSNCPESAPVAATGCPGDDLDLACAWLRSGTRLDTVPSWQRGRLLTTPSQVHDCPDVDFTCTQAPEVGQDRPETAVTQSDSRG